RSAGAPSGRGVRQRAVGLHAPRPRLERRSFLRRTAPTLRQWVRQSWRVGGRDGRLLPWWCSFNRWCGPTISKHVSQDARTLSRVSDKCVTALLREECLVLLDVVFPLLWDGVL